MKNYTRNPEAIKRVLKQTEGRQLVCTVDCKIQVPVRFNNVGLAQVGADVYIYGIFAIILSDGNYSVCNVNSMFKISPDKILTTKLDDVEYYEFHFKAGEVVVVSTDLVKRDILIYNVFNEIFFNGNIPWYMEYEDLGKIFDTSKSFADSNVNQNLEVIELIAMLVTRSSKDRTKPYRTTVNSRDDLVKNKPVFIPLKSVFYAVTNTFNKLAGSYFHDGVVSALVNPSTQSTRIENVLKA